MRPRPGARRRSRPSTSSIASSSLASRLPSIRKLEDLPDGRQGPGRRRCHQVISPRPLLPGRDHFLARVPGDRSQIPEQSLLPVLVSLLPLDAIEFSTDIDPLRNDREAFLGAFDQLFACGLDDLSLAVRRRQPARGLVELAFERLRVAQPEHRLLGVLELIHSVFDHHVEQRPEHALRPDPVEPYPGGPLVLDRAPLQHLLRALLHRLEVVFGRGNALDLVSHIRSRDAPPSGFGHSLDQSGEARLVRVGRRDGPEQVAADRVGRDQVAAQARRQRDQARRPAAVQGVGRQRLN